LARELLHDDAKEHFVIAARKEQQAKIEERLKQLHTSIQSINAELKHASAEGRAAAKAKAKVVREEYDSARRSLIASAEAELVEWKARFSTAFDVRPGRRQPLEPPFRRKWLTCTPGMRPPRGNCTP
jgi:hypothetical protein